MKGSLLIDEEFYNLYVGYQVRIWMVKFQDIQ
jgi:hypothetical protein